jgi:hypothetical protein
MHAHGTLQQAGARVQQHGLHLPRSQRISGGDVDGECFVPDVQQLGTALFSVDLIGHGFPDRRPFGARRGQDVFNSEFAERFD